MPRHDLEKKYLGNELYHKNLIWWIDISKANSDFFLNFYFWVTWYKFMNVKLHTCIFLQFWIPLNKLSDSS